MKWLKNKVRRWLREDVVELENRKYPTNPGARIETVESKGLDSEPMRLHIYRANGGTIVETRIYDRQRDRTTNQLHIIGHEQELGQSLAKIVTMESLRG